MRVLLSICLVLVMSVYHSLENYRTMNSVLVETTTFYESGLDQVLRSLEDLEETCLKVDACSKDFSDLKSSITKARIDYKRIEFLMDYLDPQLVYYEINGAPLPKLEPHVPEINILEPCGLQTLDEAIFADEQDIKQVHELTRKLLIDFSAAASFQKTRRIQHRFIFEGIRVGLVRLYTLGLTGFDTPGSANAIPEAISSLEGMTTLLHYYGEAVDREDVEIYRLIEAEMGAFRDYLKDNNDFEKLDRYEVLIKYINPLYEKTLAFQKALSVEMKKEADPTPSPLNLNATNLFADNFLRKEYYAGLTTEDLENERKKELGRTLFYEAKLSLDKNISCATCHDPKKAFTDEQAKAIGSKGLATQRNAPTLINAVYADKYFWDLRETSLERQVKHVVMDENEFNIDFIELAERLKKDEKYANLFEDAYGASDKYGISSWSISQSLSIYVASLSSFNSEFDRYVKSEKTDIPQEIRNGYNIFMGKASCGTCHFAPTFNGTVPPYYKESESEVLGVLAYYDTLSPVLDEDPGRVNNSIVQESVAFYHRSFKTSTVRNAGETGPYMHNGSINSLEDLMDFYNRGGGAGMGLNVPYQTLPDSKLNLTKSEQEDVISFIKSLSDYKQFIY